MSVAQYSWNQLSEDEKKIVLAELKQGRPLIAQKLCKQFLECTMRESRECLNQAAKAEYFSPSLWRITTTDGTAAKHPDSLVLSATRWLKNRVTTFR